MKGPIFWFRVGYFEVNGGGLVGVSESRAWVGGEGYCGVFVQGGQRVGKDLYVFHDLGSGLRYGWRLSRARDSHTTPSPGLPSSAIPSPSLPAQTMV